MNLQHKSVLVLFHLLLVVPAGCKQSRKSGGPDGYDLSKPVVFTTLPVLDEISGIAFHNGNPDTLFAEQDEEGKVFYFRPGDKKINHLKFSKKGDYEDIAVCNGYIVMLRSDGVFFTFPLASISSGEIDNAAPQPGLLPEGEYESLYAEEGSGLLYVLCKNCSTDKAGENVSGQTLRLGVDGIIHPEGNFTMAAAGIGKMAGVKNIRLKPSALARNPVTHQWYILSAVNKLLLVADSDWAPLSTYHLPSVEFTQPEGIAFDKAGNLYISNEAGEEEAGSILKFVYQKK